MDSVDTVVVGAGVIGLAVARALSMTGREVLVLEANDTFGTETSSRNSEVIHAGIYYPQGSLKAKLCVAGRNELYDFCERYGVPHRRSGKLIVATSADQLDQLEKIKDAARLNGVNLELIDCAHALTMEPSLACVAALWSPFTGIVDSHAYMLALLGQAEDAGALFAYRSSVTRVWIDDGVRIAINGEREPSLRARHLVNCAGLHAPDLATLFEGFPAAHVPQAFMAKGNYFLLGGRAPFSRLIYPVPEAGGLGVHLTLDLAGQTRFGPDVEWITDARDRIDYTVDPKRADRFYGAIKKYWPGLADATLVPGYSGVRPKISAPNAPSVDFRIDGPSDHGVPGIVNLFGIESPGLTASLAIAKHVATKLLES